MKNKIIQKEIKRLIIYKYGTVSLYAKEFGISQGTLTTQLNSENITIKSVIKHFENLDEPLNIQTTLGIKKINQHLNFFYKIINISFEFY